MSANPDALPRHASNAGRLLLVWGGWFWAINWNSVAGFLSCIATILVIMNLMGWLAPFRGALGKVAGKLFSLWHPKPAPAPTPVVRTPQDE